MKAARFRSFGNYVSTAKKHHIRSRDPAASSDDSTLFAVLAGHATPTDGGNFTLFRFRNGAIDGGVHLSPTPDTQGPAGIVHLGGDQLLGFIAQGEDGWRMASIDAATGAVRPSKADFGGAQHVHVSGSSLLLPGGGRMLATLSPAIGEPPTLFEIDTGCALLGAGAQGDCVVARWPWPSDAPTNIAVWSA